MKKRKVRKRKITEKQRIFINEYTTNGCNGTAAAKKAGYSNPSVAASKLLNGRDFPLVAEAVERRLQKRRLDADINSNDIVRELSFIAFFDPRDMVDSDGCIRNLKDLPANVARCIKKIETSYKMITDDEGEKHQVPTVKIELYDKLDALNQLAQHLGLLKDHKIITIETQFDLFVQNLPGMNSKDPIQDRIDQLKGLSYEPTEEQGTEPEPDRNDQP